MTTEERFYRIVEQKQGFRVEAPGRVPVNVTLSDTGFRVHVCNLRQLTLFAGIAANGTPLSQMPEKPDTNLVQYRRLVRLVSDGVMSEWNPPGGRVPDWKIEQWAQVQTRKALVGPIYDQWKRLTGKVDQQVWGVQKSVFAAAFRETDLLHEPSLYQDRYLVQDIQRYRAAAALVPVGENLCWARAEREVRADRQPAPADQALSLGNRTAV